MGITTREGKGSKLTIQEMDGNLTYLESKALVGKQYSYVAGNGTPAENGIELQTAYNLAKTIVGLSATNRFKIIVGTGKYQFTGQFLIDTQYIDIVSLTGDADVEFTNGINVTANNVFLKGLKTILAFQLATNLNLLVCDTCLALGSNPASFGEGVTVSGTFINCIANSGFGKFGTASGTFINCTGAVSFGYAGTASGVFINIQGERIGGYGVNSGTFTNCISELGFIQSTLTGKLFYCRLTAGTFPTVSSGGRTYYCVDGNGNTNNQ